MRIFKTPTSQKISQRFIAGLSVEIRRSKSRKKSLSLKIEPEGKVIVLAPMRTSDRDIQKLLDRKSGWIIQKRATLKPVVKRRYTNGEVFCFLGNPLTLKTRVGRVSKVTAQQDQLKVTHEPDKGDKNSLQIQLHQWYRQQAEERLPKRVESISTEIGLSPSGTQIKHYKARWGSCTSKGLIQLNWRLIMAPIPIIDYVVVHELCHLQYFNHSKAFWALVEEVCPNYRAQKVWLKQNGTGLTLD